MFAAHGMAGTSFRDIAEAAGVSVSLIQHHFGTKELLYAAVKAHAVEVYVAAQGPALATQGDELDLFIEAGLRQFFRFFEASPEWSRLVTWSQLEGDVAMWPGENDFVERMAGKVRAAQDSGQVAADMDAELLLIATAGLMTSWVTHRDRHAHRLAHLGDREAQERAYLQLCARLLLAATDTTSATARTAVIADPALAATSSSDKAKEPHR